MSDAAFMQLALAQAQAAFAAGEVPVGAVVVKDGQVLACGRNAPIATHDPSAHAEIVALRAAAFALGNYRLDGCEVFVTLEPCAMCAGAMLHSRLQRVVYGTPDLKTGAAGSVLNLFEHTQLNHQTSVQGGVLAEECAALLQDFFRARRAAGKAVAQPLLDDALRTPDECFTSLGEYPWEPRYVRELPSLGGMRMHYLDEGEASAPAHVFVHDSKAWSYQWCRHIALSVSLGLRVLAIDLPGFGKSDKPKKATWHTPERQREVLREWLQHLGVEAVHLHLPKHGDFLHLANRARAWAPVHEVVWEQPEAMPALALTAPFPNGGFQAALRAFGAAQPSDAILET